MGQELEDKDVAEADGRWRGTAGIDQPARHGGAGSLHDDDILGDYRVEESAPRGYTRTGLGKNRSIGRRCRLRLCRQRCTGGVELHEDHAR